MKTRLQPPWVVRKSDVEEPGDLVELGTIDGLDAAVQLQLGAQINVNEQSGLAIATAISDSVTVTSENDPAGGDGIKAVSEAEANAAVIQTLGTKTEDGFEPGQSNVNTAAATFEGSQVTIPTPPVDAGALPADAPDSAFVTQVDGIDVALQGQLIGQINLNGQRGLAVATAVSDDVTVTQSGYLEAGKNGIVAKSEAEATAPVVQTASQSNSNLATATFEGAQADITVAAEGNANVDVTQVDELDLALQGQLVGQVNSSSQRGASIATAIADDVTVSQSGYLTAGGDGITAVSSAEATAPVIQTATQANTNEATATFGGAQTSVDAQATKPEPNGEQPT